MRSLRLAVWVALAAGATAAPSFAQNTTSSGTSTTGGATAGTPASSSSNSTSGSSSSGSNATATTGQPTLVTTSLPTISAPAAIQNSSSNQNIAVSNVFQQTYGNPYYPGRPSATNSNPGGLGTVLYTSSGGTSRASGTALKDSGVGQIVTLPRNIAFTAQIKFTPPPMAAGRLQADLQGAIARTPSFLLSNPTAVQVQVDGNAVVLRGAVTNEDEFRMVEGIVRLTPGVGQIKNELAFPKP